MATYRYLIGIASLVLAIHVKAEELPSLSTFPDYYDSLRSNSSASLLSVTKGVGSSVYNVAFAHEMGPIVYRLAELKAFLRFSHLGKVIPQLRNNGFAVALAMHHFNNMLELGHPVLREQVLSDPALSSCNVRLTMEFFDGQGSAAVCTRTFSSVLRRPQSFQSPPTAAVIGASFSSETFPLAVYTGVNSIPQISASATSSSLDDKETFPLFGRTVLSTNDEAAVVARFFHAVGSTHVAIIFGTDTYISAMHQGFLKETTKLGIVTESLAYTDPTNADETRNVIAWLKRLQFRHVLVLCYEESLAPIMLTAAELGAATGQFLYCFPSFDVSTHIESFRVEAGSVLSRALHGTALIQMRAGGIPNRVATNKPTVPSFDEESDLGVDRFRVAWRNAFRDPSFVQYVQRKLPSSLDAMHDFDRNGNFSEDPSGYMNFLYDAVTALGISMCRAGSNVTFFGGVDIYSQFRRLDFEGASGRNKILNETGTRSYTTTSFIAWNVRVTDEVSNGEAVLEYVPSYVLDGEGWKGVSGNAFEFADGTTIAPASIPPVAFNDNYIGAPSKVIAYCLMAGVMISSAGAVVWTYYYRRDHVVDSAQPLFLVMAALGAFIMVLSIVPLSLEETVTTNKQTLDTACMLTPWLYFTGAGIAASGLLAKAKAVHKAYVDPTVEEVQVSSADVLKVASVLLSVNAAILLGWSLTSPLYWARVEKSETDSFDRPLESYATCKSDQSIFYAVALAAANIAALLCGTFWAYRCRNIATEYNESRFVGMAIASVLQLWLMGVPVLLALYEHPSLTFFVKSGLILGTSMVVLLLVFVPKVAAANKNRGRDRKDHRQLYNSFKRSASMPHFVEENVEQAAVERVPCLEASAPLPSNQIKIIHNPRSPRNLKLARGLELSLQQTRQLRMPSLLQGDNEVKISGLSGSDKSPVSSLCGVEEHGEFSGMEVCEPRLVEQEPAQRRRSI